MLVMSPDKFAFDPPQVTSHRRFSRGSTAHSLLAVEHRLASAERELRIQFTRIAQLQSELDLLLTALRRATDAHAMSLNAECVRLSSGLERGRV